MATKTYDPSQVSLIVGGTIVTNWEKITVEYDEEKWKFGAGSSGEVYRTKNSNPIGTINVELAQTSSDNAAFSGYAGSDALIPIIVQDGGGTSLHSMTEATCVTVPSAEYAKDDAGTREWSFKGALAVHIIGGN